MIEGDSEYTNKELYDIALSIEYDVPEGYTLTFGQYESRFNPDIDQSRNDWYRISCTLEADCPCDDIKATAWFNVITKEGNLEWDE